MIDLTFLHNYAPIWLLVAIVAVIFAILTLLKLSENKPVILIVSLVLGFLLISSKTISNFLIDTIPTLTLIAFIGFFILLSIAFFGKTEELLKPLTYLGIILAILGVLFFAFDNFHVLNHLLPDSSNAGLSAGAEEFKEFIYSQDFKEAAALVVSMGLVSFLLLKTAVKAK